MVKVNETKAQMQRKGMTQAQLAKKLNMNPSTLNESPSPPAMLGRIE